MAHASVLTTDEELDAALERAKHTPDLPDAVSANYNRQLDAVVIDLAGGRRLLLPRKELQGLESASEDQLAEIEIHGGNDIAWPQLDVDHYLPSLAAGQYGSGKWMQKLEMLGIPQEAPNTFSAVAKLRAFYAFDPLMAPFGSIQGQRLGGVKQVLVEGLFAGIELAFETNSLRVRALPDDSIDISLAGGECHGTGISETEPWIGYVGRQCGWMWLAMNQNGYIDTLLLAFKDTVIPEVALTVVASELEVRRLTSAGA